MAKRIFILVFITLYSFQIQAQNSFSIKVTQVYPAGGVVYGNTYSLYGDLDNAQKKLISQYTGKDANYIIELTHPSGKETKTLQNIHWILIENGIKKNLKEKPQIKASYSQPSIIEYFECDNNGKQKSNHQKIEFDYYFRFYKGDNQMGENKVFWVLDDCRKNANAYFAANKVDSLLCAIKIFNSKETEIESDINNSNEYTQYLEKQKELEIVTIEDDTIPVQDLPIVVLPSSKKEIEKQLQNLQKRAKELKKGDADCMEKMNKIIMEADIIIELINPNPTKFKRNNFFGDGCGLDDLKKGISELISINKKRK